LAEQTRKQRPLTDSNTEQAFWSNSGANGVSGKKNPYCSYCRKPRHWKDDCIRLQRKNGGSRLVVALSKVAGSRVATAIRLDQLVGSSQLAVELDRLPGGQIRILAILT